MQQNFQIVEEAENKQSTQNKFLIHVCHICGPHKE